MAARRVNDPSDESKPRHRAATTSQARENQMISLAVDTAEEMMRSGNAPAQIVTHYLKLGSSREKLEQERLAMEVELAAQKIEQLKSIARAEEMFEDAIRAMTRYQGRISEEDEVFE